MIKNKDKEASTAIQNASSLLLVAIGKRFVKEVFDQLQKNFTPGQLPHLFVITTMANLAEANRNIFFYMHLINTFKIYISKYLSSIWSSS